MRVPMLSIALLLLLMDNIIADTKLLSACSSTLSDNNPPVLEPLRAVIGDNFANLFVGLLGNSAISKFILSTSGSLCLANINGTALGQVLVSSTAVNTCVNALEMLNLPLVQRALGNLSVQLSTNSGAMDAFIQDLRHVDEEQIEHICSLYVDGFVPCLQSQLLPSLSTLRSTSACGCCAAWESESLLLYNYTITGQYTKIAQLFGDVLCATQTPAFNGSSSQRCGFTFLQSSGEVANTTATDRAAALLKDLRVPTDQTCLKAENKAYFDVDGNAVEAASSNQYTASGCVVALDRLATWISGLPLADNSSKSYGVDLQSLFGFGKCVSGADVFPLIQDFLSSSIVNVMSTHFSEACLHVPIKYADGCSFSRPASLVDWNYIPPHASKMGSKEDGDSTSPINSLKTVPPNVTEANAAVFRSAHEFTASVTAVLSVVLMSIMW